jgi:hypothetical protein
VIASSLRASAWKYLCLVCAATTILLLALTGCAGAQVPDYALRIIAKDHAGGTVCSATAVAPDAIETAQHCLKRPLVSINGVPASVVRSELVAEDRLRVVVSGVRFKHWARLARPVVGERVRWWGQPRGLPFVYRRGYIAVVADDGLLIAGTICPGDSGSGLFNNAGDLVGVISAMTSESACGFVVGR